jgi:hypothetical protein
MTPRTSTGDSTFFKTTASSGCMSPRYLRVTPKPKELRSRIWILSPLSVSISGERLTDFSQRDSQWLEKRAASLSAKRTRIPPMPLVPSLQTRYDENGIPVSAKCSLCGEQMPQGKPRITNPIENVAWFTFQFGLHVAQSHPPVAGRKWVGFGGETHELKTQRD